MKKRKSLKTLIFGFLYFVLIGAGIFNQTHVQDSAPPSTPSSIQETKSDQEKINPEIQKFGLEIAKIGVLTPVIKNVDGIQKNAYEEALKKGVAHYKGTSLPGQGSNIFIFGHSGTVLGEGPTVFTRLNELEKGDSIIIYYQSKKFEYSVFGKEIVEKTDSSALDATKKEQLTLMTCWPIGSDAKRLIIKASRNTGS